MMPAERQRPFVGSIVISAFVAVVSCSAAPDAGQGGAPAGERATAAPTAETVAGIPLSLSQRDKSCRLTSRNGATVALDLQISWPCAFHRGRDGAVRVLVDRGDSIFLVESSRPDPDRTSRCVTEVQAVRVRNGMLHPSEHHDVVTMCLPFQWDEVMFKGLFDP